MAKRLTAILMVLALCCLSIYAGAETESWTCPKCGQEGNTGNFCGNCAEPRPVSTGDSWTCPKCGQEGNTGNFCGNCAEPRPEKEGSETQGTGNQPSEGADVIHVPGGKSLPILDPASYPGTWKEAYRAILQKHEPGILAYEAHTIEYDDSRGSHVFQCYPVGLADLTGDGTKELLILDLNTDSGDGELYIYSADRNPACCIFSLPALTQTYDDELEGVRLYLAADGGQQTFVVEYWEYGCMRYLQLKPDAACMSVLNAWSDNSTDFSGESNGAYSKNGQSISWDQLVNDREVLRAKATKEVGSILWTSGGDGYGFSYRLQDALNSLK